MQIHGIQVFHVHHIILLNIVIRNVFTFFITIRWIRMGERFVIYFAHTLRQVTNVWVIVYHNNNIFITCIFRVVFDTLRNYFFGIFCYMTQTSARLNFSQLYWGIVSILNKPLFMFVFLCEASHKTFKFIFNFE